MLGSWNGGQGCSVLVKLFGTGCTFPQAHGPCDPLKTSTVCVVCNYKHELDEGDILGSHRQKGRKDTENRRGLWDASGKTRSPNFRPCPHQQEPYCSSSISIPVDDTAQRTTTCSKAIPLWRKVPPSAAAPLSLVRARAQLRPWILLDKLPIRDTGFVEAASLLPPEKLPNSGHETAKTCLSGFQATSRNCKSLLQMLFQLPQPWERFSC